MEDANMFIERFQMALALISTCFLVICFFFTCVNICLHFFKPKTHWNQEILVTRSYSIARITVIALKNKYQENNFRNLLDFSKESRFKSTSDINNIIGLMLQRPSIWGKPPPLPPPPRTNKFVFDMMEVWDTCFPFFLLWIIL